METIVIALISSLATITVIRYLRHRKNGGK